MLLPVRMTYPVRPHSPERSNHPGASPTSEANPRRGHIARPRHRELLVEEVQDEGSPLHPADRTGHAGPFGRRQYQLALTASRST